MQIGSLTAFLTYLMQILMSVMMATFMAIMIPRAAVCAERIGEVLDTESSVRAAGAPVHRRVADAASSSCATSSFAYPGAADPVLRDISLPAQPGQTTAIIGSTGAGKTHPALADPPAVRRHRGHASWSTASTSATLDPEVLWRRIGLVPQKAYLFTGTVASNLRYGNPDATDDELWEALEVAQARDFVEAMPDGLDAPIAQGGTNVSGGQRQRLAIARALVAQAGDLPVRRLLLRARPGHRRPAAGGAAAAHPGRDRGDRRAAGVHHRRRRPDHRARGRRDRRGRHATRSCWPTCPTYAEIVESQLAAAGGGVSSPATAAPGAPPGRADGRGSAAGRWAGWACRPRSR